MAKFTTTFHDSAKHLVVAAAGKEDLAGVKLEEGAANGPDVDGKVIRHTEDNFRSSVESTDQVGRDLVFGSVRRGAKIADFEHVTRFVNEYVVRLQV